MCVYVCASACVTRILFSRKHFESKTNNNIFLGVCFHSIEFQNIKRRKSKQFFSHFEIDVDDSMADSVIWPMAHCASWPTVYV